jgi:hypothetical protein
METSARPWSIRGIVGEGGALWSSDAMKVWTLITLVVTATIAPLPVSVQPMANASTQQTEDMRVLAA